MKKIFISEDAFSDLNDGFLNVSLPLDKYIDRFLP